MLYKCNFSDNIILISLNVIFIKDTQNIFIYIYTYMNILIVRYKNLRKQVLNYLIKRVL